MNGSPADRLRLTGRDGVGIACLLLFGVASLVLGLHLFPSVYPEATIDFQVDRKASKALAERFVQERQLDLAGYRHASVFVHDDTAKVFLERELGLEAMNEAVAQTARIWAWSHRWFRPITVEEYTVDITPTGELVRFVHLLADTAGGANLSEEEARGLAEESLADLRDQGLDGLRYLGATSHRLDHRTDHRFTWEREGIDWEGARYRHRVTIRGDRLGGYEEFVQVPEEWMRDYNRLRSNNLAAGAVGSAFYVLTILAMFVVLFLELRKRRLRWGFAVLLGLFAVALTLLSQISNLSGTLYRYDTSDSFGGFLAVTVLGALLSALGSGVLITLVVATGENRYRMHYPQKLSLPALFTWRGLRTKEFLLSAIAGLVLGCGFIAYQTVFYRVASSLGAWAPADVPYTELLNSSIPWAFLLFIGFFPAVSEEFMSRAFSIPFFSKLLRSRAGAIVLASLIWGLLHSAYPNQPFYIRVIELTVFGAFASILMIRFNLLILLVWHYTIDAVYSGYLLFRSADPYYVASAGIASGLLVLPLIVAVVAAIRTRTFADPEGLRHSAEPLPEEPAIPPPPPPLVHVPVAPLERQRALMIVGVSAVALAAVLAVTAGWKERRLEAPIAVDRATAQRRAEGFLAGQGIDPERFRRVILFADEIDPDASRYVLAQQGLEGTASVWPDRLAAQSWRFRFFEPSQTEEVRLRVDAHSGRVVAYEHRIAEGDSLPTAIPAVAESLAIDLLGSVGLVTQGMERKEASDEPRPKRTDRSYAWEAAQGDDRNIAEARYRLEATVAGDRTTGFGEKLRLPEEYTRARSKRTMLWGVALSLILIGLGVILGFSVFDASRSRANGRIPFTRLIPAGVAGLLISIVATLNALPRVIYRYETSVPWSNYMILIIVSLFTAMVLYFFLAWVGTGMVLRLHPAVASLADAASRKRMIPAALLALILAPAWLVLLGEVDLLLAAWFPRIASSPALNSVSSLDTAVPAIGVLVSVLPRAFLLCSVVAMLVHLLGSRALAGPMIRYGALLALAVGLALLPARGVGEFLIRLLQISLVGVVAFGFVRILLRDNPLAYIGAAYGIYAVEGVGGLIKQPDSWVRGQGIAAVVLLLLPVVALLVGAGRTKSRQEGIESSEGTGNRPSGDPVPSGVS